LIAGADRSPVRWEPSGRIAADERAVSEMDQRPLVALFNTSWTMSPTPATDIAAPLRVTSDHTLLPQADAVAFHLPTLAPNTLPSKLPGQIWIASWMESEIWCPKVVDPGFMAQFDITMSHRRDSDVWAPYFGPWVLTCPLEPATSRAGGVVYVQSNDNDRCGQQDYVRRLMTRVKIDSFGRSLNNMRLAEDRGRETKMQIFGRYKLTLAFENSIARDYVTEKFYDPLAAGSVPVYRGAPNIDELAPAPNCFINAARFASPDDVAAYLNHVLGSDGEYQRYLDWRTSGASAAFMAALDQIKLSAMQRLAQRINQLRTNRGL
jgi:hypothetical protein